MQLQSFVSQLMMSALSIWLSCVYAAPQSCDAHASQGHLALVQRLASFTATSESSVTQKETELEAVTLGVAEIPTCEEDQKKEAIDALKGLTPVKDFVAGFKQGQNAVAAVYSQDLESDCQMGNAKWDGRKGHLHVRVANTGWISDGKSNWEVTWDNGLPLPDCCAKAPYTGVAGMRRNLRTSAHPTKFTTESGANRTYALYVPSKCAHSKCPLLVFLNGTDQGVVNEMLGCGGCKAKMGVITLMPYLGAFDKWQDAKDDWRHDNTMEDYVRPLVQKTLQENRNIDRSRVYVSGQSMGGVGALYAALTMPDIFTHAFPFSPTDFGSGRTLSVMRAGVSKLWKQRSGKRKLKNIHITMGAKDSIPPSRYAALKDRNLDWYKTAQWMQDLGVTSKVYVELHLELAMAHCSWVSTINKIFSEFWEGSRT